MAAARSVRRLRSAESANSRNTALRDVPRRVASASTSLRRSSGIDTMTFAMLAVYRGIRWRATAVGQPMPITGASNCAWFARRAVSPIVIIQPLPRAPLARASDRVPLVGVLAVSALRLDLEIDLHSVDRHAGRRLDAEAHFCAVVRQHHDLDLVADHDALSGLPRQDEHKPRLPDPTQPARTPSPRRTRRTSHRHTNSLSSAIIPYEVSAAMNDREPEAHTYA
jgi:hypothetical protein